jgi:hypothetical protein
LIQANTAWSGELGLVAQGAETRVNPVTTGTQSLYAYGGGGLSMDTAGNYVVVYRSDQTGDFNIYAQRYNAAGVAQGGVIAVNTTTANAQDQPSVDMAADGRFVVSWHSFSQDSAGSYGTYARLYAANGTPVTGELQVNTTTVGNQYSPRVAMDDSGAFVVIFHDESSNAGDLLGQRYNAAGVAQGGNFLINTDTTVAHGFSDISVDGLTGNFVVVWTGTDGGAEGVYGRRFSATGTAFGGVFQINTSVNTFFDAKVSVASDGSFAVAWDADTAGSTNVMARRFAANGTALTGEIVANTYLTGRQYWGDVASAPDGRFVVAWESDLQDGSAGGVYTQVFDASGNKIGAETRVNTTTSAVCCHWLGRQRPRRHARRVHAALLTQRRDRDAHLGSHHHRGRWHCPVHRGAEHRPHRQRDHCREQQRHH